MGNQTSQPSNDFQRQFLQLQEQMKQQQRRSNIDLHRLQQQIYHTQLKMQEMKQKTTSAYYQQPPPPQQPHEQHEQQQHQYQQ